MREEERIVQRGSHADENDFSLRSGGLHGD
jgi:hypothetical protein